MRDAGTGPTIRGLLNVLGIGGIRGSTVWTTETFGARRFRIGSAGMMILGGVVGVTTGTHRVFTDKDAAAGLAFLGTEAIAILALGRPTATSVVKGVDPM